MRICPNDLGPIRCGLCSGFLVDAMTINECLHSFCRSCLSKHLGSSRLCPACTKCIHKTKPWSSVKPDPQLQMAVNKIVPNLVQNEMSRRREHYAKKANPLVVTKMPSAAQIKPGAPQALTDNDYFQPSDEQMGKYSGSCLLGDDDMVSLQLTPMLSEESSLSKAPLYLLMISTITIDKLKRFIRLRYKLSPSDLVWIFDSKTKYDASVDLRYVSLACDWDRTGPLCLNFAIVKQCLIDEINRSKHLAEKIAVDCAQVLSPAATPSPKPVKESPGRSSPSKKNKKSSNSYSPKKKTPLTLSEADLSLTKPELPNLLEPVKNNRRRKNPLTPISPTSTPDVNSSISCGTTKTSNGNGTKDGEDRVLSPQNNDLKIKLKLKPPPAIVQKINIDSSTSPSSSSSSVSSSPVKAPSSLTPEKPAVTSPITPSPPRHAPNIQPRPATSTSKTGVHHSSLLQHRKILPNPNTPPPRKLAKILPKPWPGGENPNDGSEKIPTRKAPVHGGKLPKSPIHVAVIKDNSNLSTPKTPEKLPAFNGGSSHDCQSTSTPNSVNIKNSELHKNDDTSMKVVVDPSPSKETALVASPVMSATELMAALRKSAAKSVSLPITTTTIIPAPPPETGSTPTNAASAPIAQDEDEDVDDDENDSSGLMIVVEEWPPTETEKHVKVRRL